LRFQRPHGLQLMRGGLPTAAVVAVSGNRLRQSRLIGEHGGNGKPGGSRYSFSNLRATDLVQRKSLTPLVRGARRVDDSGSLFRNGAMGGEKAGPASRRYRAAANFSKCQVYPPTRPLT
jgi:hypothetical protein